MTRPPARILVVGPDLDATGFITAVLARDGLSARSALTGTAAAELVAADPPFTAVVLDADLAALRSIRSLADSRRAAIPTMVLGALGAPSSAATEAREHGADFWLDRPIDEANLLEGIRRMLGNAENPDETEPDED